MFVVYIDFMQTYALMRQVQLVDLNRLLLQLSQSYTIKQKFAISLALYIIFALSVA